MEMVGSLPSHPSFHPHHTPSANRLILSSFLRTPAGAAAYRAPGFWSYRQSPFAVCGFMSMKTLKICETL